MGTERLAGGSGGAFGAAEGGVGVVDGEDVAEADLGDVAAGEVVDPVGEGVGVVGGVGAAGVAEPHFGVLGGVVGFALDDPVVEG